MRSLIGVAVLLVAGAFVTLGFHEARSQSPFAEGAFVLSQDGYAYVVSNGTAYPITFATDDGGALPAMLQGPAVSRLSDLPGAPTPTPAAARAPAPSPTPVLLAGVGTRENPVPIGTAVTLTDGWQINVLSVTPDATAQVLANNRYNKPPEAGHQYFIARITATYTGQDSSNFSDYRPRAVGASAVSYAADCDSYPDEIRGTDVFTGGTVTGNVCWSILTSDVGSLVMYDEIALKDKRVFLSLH